MPNQLVQFYRQSNPDGLDPEQLAALPDDEITSHYAAQAQDYLAQGVDIFAKYPDFKADHDRIEKQRVLDSITVGDRAKQFVGSIPRAALGAVASIPKAGAVVAQRIDKALGNEVKPIEEMGLQKVGRGIEAVGEALAPDVDPEKKAALDESFFNTKVPSAGGSALGFMAGGGVAGGIAKGVARGVVQKAAIGALGAASAGVEQYEDAKAHGADEDTAWNAFLLGSAVGTTEIVPLSRMLDRISMAVPGGKQSIRKMLLEASKESMEETLQEAFQSGAGDVIAKNLLEYDKDRKLFSELKEDAAAGGITGFLFSLLTQRIGHIRAGGLQSQPATPAGTDPMPPSIPTPGTDTATISPSDIAEAGYGIKLETLKQLAQRKLADPESTVVEEANLEPDQERMFRRIFVEEAKQKQTAATPTTPAEAPKASAPAPEPSVPVAAPVDVAPAPAPAQAAPAVEQTKPEEAVVAPDATFMVIGADHKEYGPITAAQLRQWITEGRADAQTLTRFDGGQRKPLSTFPEFAPLFGASEAPTTPAPESAPVVAAPEPKKPNLVAAKNLGYLKGDLASIDGSMAKVTKDIETLSKQFEKTRAAVQELEKEIENKTGREAVRVQAKLDTTNALLEDLQQQISRKSEAYSRSQDLKHRYEKAVADFSEEGQSHDHAVTPAAVEHEFGTLSQEIDTAPASATTASEDVSDAALLAEEGQAALTKQVDSGEETEVAGQEKTSKRKTMPGYYEVGENNAPSQMLTRAISRYGTASSESQKEALAVELGTLLSLQAPAKSGGAITEEKTRKVVVEDGKGTVVEEVKEKVTGTTNSSRTRRVTAWQTPTGQVILTGTLPRRFSKKAGVKKADDLFRFSTDPDVVLKTGSKEGTKGIRELLDAGNKPIASMLLRSPRYQVVRTLGSRELYDAEFGELKQLRDSAYGATISDVVTTARGDYVDSQAAIGAEAIEVSAKDTAVQWGLENQGLLDEMANWYDAQPDGITSLSLIATFGDRIRASVEGFNLSPDQQADLSSKLNQDLLNLLGKWNKRKTQSNVNTSARTAQEGETGNPQRSDVGNASGGGSDQQSPQGGSQAAEGQAGQAAAGQGDLQPASSEAAGPDLIPFPHVQAALQAMAEAGKISQSSLKEYLDRLRWADNLKEAEDELAVAREEAEQGIRDRQRDPSEMDEVDFSTNSITPAPLLPDSPENIEFNIRRLVGKAKLPTSPAGLLGQVSLGQLNRDYPNLKEALLKIAKDFASDSKAPKQQKMMAALAKALADSVDLTGAVLRVSNSPNTTKLGRFDSDTNEIAVFANTHRDEVEFQITVLHEALHAYTTRLLRRAQQAPSSLTDFEHDFVIKMTGIVVGARGAGLTWQDSEADPAKALDEFIAAAMTDAKFQQALDGVAMVSESGSLWAGFKKLLSKIVDVLLSRFDGLIGNAGAVKGGALEATTDLVNQLIERYGESTAFLDQAWTVDSIMRQRQAGIASDSTRFSLTPGGQFDSEMARRLYSNEYVPDRIPQEAEAEGRGTLGQAAADIVGRSHAAIRPDQAREFASIPNRAQRQGARNALNRLVKPQEEAALRQWIAQRGLMLDSGEFNRKWIEQGKRGETEHNVYFDPQSRRWFKANNLTYYGNWLEYFQNVSLHNWLFPEAPLKLEGFIEDEGQLMPVVSQPHIRFERGATQEETARKMAEMGFRPGKVKDSYLNSELGIEVADLHDENSVVTADGEVIIIDPNIFMDAATKLERLRQVYRPPESESGSGIRYREAQGLFNDRRDLQVVARNEAMRMMATHNTIGDVFEETFTKWAAVGGNRSTSGAPLLSFSQFMQSMVGSAFGSTIDVDAARASIHDSVAKQKGGYSISSATRISDLEQRGEAPKAARDAADILWKAYGRAVRYAKMVQEQFGKKRIMDKLARSAADLSEVLQRFDDMTVLNKEFIKELRRSNTESEDVGAGAIAKLLGVTTGRKAALQAAVNWAQGDMVAYGDALSGLADLGLDYSLLRKGGLTALDVSSAIAGSTDPRLAVLAADPAKLAVALQFARQRPYVMALMEARKAGDQDGPIIRKVIEMATSDRPDAFKQAQGLLSTLKRMGATGQRILDRLREKKEEHRRLLDVVKRFSEFEHYWSVAEPIILEKIRGIERRLEMEGHRDQRQWHAVNGATYVVPTSPNQPEHELTGPQANTAQIVFGEKFNPAKIRSDTWAIRDWLKANSAKSGTETYRWMERVAKQLDTLTADSAVRIIQRGPGGLIIRWLGDSATKMELTGLQSGREIAKLIRRFNTLYESHLRPTDAKEFHTFDQLYGKAMRSTGIGHSATFRDTFYSPAFGYLESRQDLLDPALSNEQMLDKAMAAVKAHLSNHDAFKKNPKAWDDVEALLRQGVKCVEAVEKTRRSMGLKVKDVRKDGRVIFREAIGVPAFTMSRAVHESIRVQVRKMTGSEQTPWQGKWKDAAGGVKAELSKARVAALYNTDRAALINVLAPRFTPEVMEKFVQPLIQKPGKTNFMGPEIGGVKNACSRSNLVEAFIRAGGVNGDILRFAEELHSLELGTPETLADFVGQTMATFQHYVSELNTIASVKDLTADSAGEIGRTFLDARQGEDYPAEWLDFRTFGHKDFIRYVRIMAQNAAFGDGMADIQANFTKTHNELSDLKQQYEDAQKAPTPAERDRLLNAGGLRKARENAAKNLFDFERSRDEFVQLMTALSGPPQGLTTLHEMVGLMAGLTVQGLTTAVTDTISFPESAFRKFGFSKQALAFFSGEWKQYGHEALGSLMQAIGSTLRENVEQAKITRFLNEAGLADMDALTKARGFKAYGERYAEELADQMTLRAIMKRSPNAWEATKGVAAGVLKRGMAAVKVGMNTGIGVAKTKEQAFASVKLLAPFTQNSILMHRASARQWLLTVSEAVRKATDYLRAHPADLNNPNFKFDSTKLNYSRRSFLGTKLNDQAFQYLNETLQRNGISLEETAREAIRNGVTGLDALTFEQVHSVMALSASEVLLNSGVTTRPGWSLTGGGRFVAPLMGWSLYKTVDLVKTTRDPKLKASGAAFGQAMTAFMFGVLPATIIYAMLRDEYEEEAMGKKANVLSIKPDANLPMSLMDNLSRVGAFGILGELPNAIFNPDTTREFSVDSRVFLASSFKGVKDTVMKLVKQDGTVTYDSIVRPFLASVGGSGYLQNIDVIQNALGLDNAERRVVRRINVSNQLRSIGRELDMDIRVARGVVSMPSPVKPWISQMVLAAYANDPVGFRAAYQKALVAAQKLKAGDPKADPYADVAEAYQRMHPLRSVFNKSPSTAEYQKALRALGDDGKDVAQAIGYFNSYGAQVPNKRGGTSIKPFYGTDRTEGSAGGYRSLVTGLSLNSGYRSVAAGLR